MKMLMSHQRTETPDARAILIARELLKISEYEIFIKAYSAWYGHIPDEHQIDKMFGEYLATNELPFFVNHFCRNVIQTKPREFASWQARLRQSHRAGFFAVIAIILMVIGALSLT